MINTINKYIKEHWKDTLKDYLIPALIAIVLVTLIKSFLFYIVKVPSESMFPTIKIGDRIVVTKVYEPNNLKRGDIVVFYSEELNTLLIKRLIGLPNDKIKIDEDGTVYVNGEKTPEDYVVFKEKLKGEYTVPENKFFFCGDNRANSNDSRHWSNPFIDGKEIKAKAQFIIFPFNRFGHFITGVDALK